MSEVIGVVEKVSVMDSPANSARKWTKKSFLVNSEWYGGFVNADNSKSINSINEGDSVKIKYEQKGEYKNLVGIQVIEGDVKGTPTETKAINASKTTLTEKDFRITYLASRRDAIEFVKQGITLEMFDVGKKKSSMADIFYDLVDVYAMKFAMQAYEAIPDNTVNDVKAVEAPRAVNE